MGNPPNAGATTGLENKDPPPRVTGPIAGSIGIEQELLNQVRQ